MFFGPHKNVRVSQRRHGFRTEAWPEVWGGKWLDWDGRSERNLRHRNSQSGDGFPSNFRNKTRWDTSGVGKKWFKMELQLKGWG